MKTTYKAILFHPDGKSVTDFRNTNSKEEVWENIQNMGSRWIFYPLCFIGTDTTIVSTPEGLEHLQGKRIATVKKYLIKNWKKNSKEIADALNNGNMPLSFIYQ